MKSKKEDYILFLNGREVGIIPVKKVKWIWNPLTDKKKKGGKKK